MKPHAHPDGEDKPRLRLMPRRLGHVNLFVSDLEQSMAFYENVAGFHEIFREADIQAGFLSNGNTHHDFGLIQTSDVDRVDKNGKVLIAASQRGRTAGLNHLGFEMTSERQLVAVHDEFRRVGLPPGRTVDHGLARSVYLTDPDGNTIEFYADTVSDWRSFWRDNLGETVTHGWVPDHAAASDHPLYPQDGQRDVKEGTPFQSWRVFAATLNTQDIEAMVAFYEDVVGLRVTAGSVEDGACTLGTDVERECLILNSVPARSSALEMIHVAIDPLQDARRVRETLARLGIPASATEPNGALLLRDPDGFQVRFVRHP